MHKNCEWTIASGDQLLQDEIQEYRLNFTKEQNQLEGEIFLHQLQISVMRRNRANGKIVPPNTAKNRHSDERHEVINRFVECCNVFDVDHVENHHNQNVSDRHLQYQESYELEFAPENRNFLEKVKIYLESALRDWRSFKWQAATAGRRAKRECFVT